MKRVLRFNKKEGRYDVPSFTLCNNDALTIEVVAPAAVNGVYYFTAVHGEQIKRVVLAGRMSLSLSPDWLSKGGVEPLLCELELRDKAGVVTYERYEAEPLLLKRVEVGREFLASVQAIEARQKTLESDIQSLKEEFQELKKVVAKIPFEIERAKNDAVIEAAGGDPMGA